MATTERSKPRFSKKYDSFELWLDAQKNPNTSYVKRIVSGHKNYPSLTLQDLSGKGKANEQQMQIVVGKTIKTVTPKNARNRSLIGQYWNAVKQTHLGGDEQALGKFKKKYWVDSEGNKHRFVTDDDILYQLHKQNKLKIANNIYMTK